MVTRWAESFDAWYPGIGVWFELRVEPASDGGLALYFSTSPSDGWQSDG